MQAWLPMAMLALVCLSGCSYETGRPDDDAGDGGNGGNEGNGGAQGSDDGPTAEPEGDSGVLDITIESDGAATLEVPFPTLDSCRGPVDWMAGGASVEGAVPELRNVTGERSGQVLALSTMSPRAEWSVQIPLGPTCATFRHDPWSIDPDAENGTVEVRVTEGQVSMVTVLVRRVRDGSGEAVLYEGTPSGDGWTALAEKTTVPIGG